MQRAFVVKYVHSRTTPVYLAGRIHRSISLYRSRKHLRTATFGLMGWASVIITMDRPTLPGYLQSSPSTAQIQRPDDEKKIRHLVISCSGKPAVSFHLSVCQTHRPNKIVRAHLILALLRYGQRYTALLDSSKDYRLPVLWAMTVLCS